MDQFRIFQHCGNITAANIEKVWSGCGKARWEASLQTRAALFFVVGAVL